MKRFLKIFLFFMFSVAALSVATILGFRYWLKNNLPQYIQEKTPYNITYKDLKIRFLQGDITVSKIRISNKNPGNQGIIGLEGNIDTIYISNLGMYDALVNKTVNSDEIQLSKPNLTITLAKPSSPKKEKKKNPIVFKNMMISNGNFVINRRNGFPLLKIKKLSLSVDNLDFTEEDELRKLPFVFDDYSLKGNDFELFPDEVYKVTAKNIDTENGKLSVKDFEILPQMKLKSFQQKFPYKNLVQFEASELSFNKTELKNNRISFNEILFSQPKLTLFESKMKKKRSENNLPYELDLKNVIFQNAQFDLKDFDGKQKLSVKNINASINDFLVNGETTKGKIPFSYKDYRIKTGDILFKVNEFYQLKMNELFANKEGWQFNDFSMLPLLSRQKFSKRIKTEKDWYHIKIAETKISGIDFKFTNNQPNVNINTIDFNGVEAIIFRSKFPKDDLSRKKMYSELLRSIKFPLLVKNLNVTNSYLQYEEDNINENPAGKLIFSDFNLKAQNLNSNKGFHKTLVPISIQCKFMKTSPMNVNWSFDTARNDDFFKISGNISNLPAENINLFVQPYLNITVQGEIRQLNFNYSGNNTHIFGDMNMIHKDLKVSILDKETKQKKKFLSALVNLFVKSNSKKFPESVEVDVRRDNTKSFFNLFWRGIEEGLKKTLISKKIEQKEEKIKKTVEKVKEIKKKVDEDKETFKKKMNDRFKK